MGIYSELVMALQLKSDTPEKVINTLQYLCGENVYSIIPNDYIFPDHPFFRTEKGLYIFRYSRNSFDSIPGSSIAYEVNSNAYFLTIRVHLKNYDLEFEYFLEWIAPYSQTGDKFLQFIGYIHNEDLYNPALIYIYKSKVWIVEITPRLNLSDSDDEDRLEPNRSLTQLGARGFIELKDYINETLKYRTK